MIEPCGLDRLFLEGISKNEYSYDCRISKGGSRISKGGGGGHA